jgi:branched-chain amino acid aminotransferase
MTEKRPAILWFNGAIVPWDQGTVHVWSELAIRGVSVFEGLRSYWSAEDRCHNLVALDLHLKRLYESARIMRLPVDTDASTLTRAIYDLIAALGHDEHLYVRPTLYVDSGRYAASGRDVVCGAYIVAFPVPRAQATLMGARCCVSTWRRASDLTMPPRAKAGAAYQAFRLPLIEAQQRGFDDAILLNDRGTVAEATGAAVFIVRDGDIITPPATSGILESITRRLVIDLLRTEYGRSVIEREIDRTELYVADEIFMCGTLAEVQPVVEIDDLVVGGGAPGPVTTAVRDRYQAHCESPVGDRPTWLTAVPTSDAHHPD